MLDWKIFEWLNFFDVMTWWKWPLAFLLGCAFIAITTGCIFGIKYFHKMFCKYMDKIWNDDDEE